MTVWKTFNYAVDQLLTIRCKDKNAVANLTQNAFIALNIRWMKNNPHKVAVTPITNNESIFWIHL